MHFIFNPNTFSLGLAVGVLVLVLLLSLIVSYAYDESTLLFLAVYMIVMAALFFVGERLFGLSDVTQRMLLILGPALIAALQMWVLRKRQTVARDKLVMGCFVLLSLAAVFSQAASSASSVPLSASLLWLMVLVVASVCLCRESWRNAGVLACRHDAFAAITAGLPVACLAQ